MLYRMYGDICQLIRYIIRYKEGMDDVILRVATEEEKDGLISKLPTDYTVEEISQPEYEWLDGMIFEDESKVLIAAGLGKEEWEKTQHTVNVNQVLGALMLEVAKLKVGV